jgi:hypothetical protein
VQQGDLKKFLTDFAGERLALLQRHEAAARVVGHYDFNNTYQYVIAREEMHVSWVRDAIIDVGGGEPAEVVAEPVIQRSGKGLGAESALISQDRDGAQAFVDKWRPRVATLSHARHRIMLDVILGETLEHKRFFEQAVAGRTDLLGRRADGAGTGGGVLPTRWIEQ